MNDSLNFQRRIRIRLGIYGTIVKPPGDSAWQIKYVDAEVESKFPIIAVATGRIHAEEAKWESLRFATPEAATAFLMTAI